MSKDLPMSDHVALPSHRLLITDYWCERRSRDDGSRLFQMAMAISFVHGSFGIMPQPKEAFLPGFDQALESVKRRPLMANLVSRNFACSQRLPSETRISVLRSLRCERVDLLEKQVHRAGTGGLDAISADGDRSPDCLVTVKLASHLERIPIIR